MSEPTIISASLFRELHELGDRYGRTAAEVAAVVLQAAAPGYRTRNKTKAEAFRLLIRFQLAMRERLDTLFSADPSEIKELALVLFDQAVVTRLNQLRERQTI